MDQETFSDEHDGAGGRREGGPNGEAGLDGEPAADGAGRRPTMKQVAALAGVSLATVSRVVNGGPKVRPDLAARVHEAVAAQEFVMERLYEEEKREGIVG